MPKIKQKIPFGLRLSLFGLIFNIAIGVGGFNSLQVFSQESPIGCSDSVTQEVFRGDFSSDWEQAWGLTPDGNFGQLNRSVFTVGNDSYLQVSFPEGSVNPEHSAAPVGGTGFLTLLSEGYDTLCLEYRIRFPEDFDFARGGKLPGLYGGPGFTGEEIPNRGEGFSTPFTWREGGKGAVNTYLFSRDGVDSQPGSGNWSFLPGKWHTLTQEIKLNTANQKNGKITTWFDGYQVQESTDLELRSDNSLTIDGIVFSTYFGGSDVSWAATKDETIDFANFRLYGVFEETMNQNQGQVLGQKEVVETQTQDPILQDLVRSGGTTFGSILFVVISVMLATFIVSRENAPRHNR